MISIEQFASGFSEDSGYVDFAKVGPLGSAVIDEERAHVELLRRARFGSLDLFETQGLRVREAVAQLIGFRSDQVVFQPNASTALMHVMFGVTGGVLLSATDFPSVLVAAARAADSLGVLVPTLLETQGGPVTPGSIREQLSANIVAVAVSLVDYRTGYLADIEGIRQVIGDRMLIVDAAQGFGVVDAPFEVADVVISNGHKWTRAGWGTGFLALSDRAAERLTPVFSGFDASTAVETDTGIAAPIDGAAAYSIRESGPLAQARFAAALEEIALVGVPAIRTLLSEKVSRIISLADEFALPVSSSRAGNERAGIVVIEPAPDQLTVFAASLFNHGVSATVRPTSVRLSPHVSTGEESFEMLRAAFVSYTSATKF